MMKITPTNSTISSDAVEGSTIELRVKRQPDETHPSAVLAAQLLLGKQAVAVRDIPLSGPIRLGTMVVNV